MRAVVVVSGYWRDGGDVSGRFVRGRLKLERWRDVGERVLRGSMGPQRRWGSGCEKAEEVGSGCKKGEKSSLGNFCLVGRSMGSGRELLLMWEFVGNSGGCQEREWVEGLWGLWFTWELVWNFLLLCWM